VSAGDNAACNMSKGRGEYLKGCLSCELLPTISPFTFTSPIWILSHAHQNCRTHLLSDANLAIPAQKRYVMLPQILISHDLCARTVY
jgi:hypothetical protein